MKFLCKCGYILHDSTDCISYKGIIIADQDWDDFYDRIEEAIKSKEEDKEKVMEAFWHDTLDVGNTIYQCPECGSIFISGEGRKLHSFKPNHPVPLNLLNSAKGEKWQGYLYGEWDDVKAEWMEHHGHIWANVNEKYDIPEYDNYEAFERKYYELFEELKNKGIIRSARLKRNKQLIHSWEVEKLDKQWNS